MSKPRICLYILLGFLTFSLLMLGNLVVELGGIVKQKDFIKFNFEQTIKPAEYHLGELK